ncbi:DCTN2 [Cordylochernes scorpioides]|uniref:DCTN2 n=1 Tax=Cordylochernes scorpioides TaxID=51811 RepID=A0ABY6L220_9ARAC|nr:DCTN2 [Cordylochernes scorpioides]
MLQWPPILAKVQPHQRVQVTKRGSGTSLGCGQEEETLEQKYKRLEAELETWYRSSPISRFDSHIGHFILIKKKMLQWPPILAKVQLHQQVQVTKRGYGTFEAAEKADINETTATLQQQAKHLQEKLVGLNLETVLHSSSDTDLSNPFETAQKLHEFHEFMLLELFYDEQRPLPKSSSWVHSTVPTVLRNNILYCDYGEVLSFTSDPCTLTRALLSQIENVKENLSNLNISSGDTEVPDNSVLSYELYLKPQLAAKSVDPYKVGDFSKSYMDSLLFLSQVVHLEERIKKLETILGHDSNKLTGSTTQWQADLIPKEMAASDMRNRCHVQPLLTGISPTTQTNDKSIVGIETTTKITESLAKAGVLGLPEARESTTQLDERDLLCTIKTQCLQEWKYNAAHDWYRAGGISTGSVLPREQQSLIFRLKSGHLRTMTFQNGCKAAINILSARTALLDPSNLEQLEGRLGALQQRLATVASSRTTEEAMGGRVSELYDLAKRADTLGANVPGLLDHLLAVKDLHVQDTASPYPWSGTEVHQLAWEAKKGDKSIECMNKIHVVQAMIIMIKQLPTILIAMEKYCEEWLIYSETSQWFWQFNQPYYSNTVCDYSWGSVEGWSKPLVFDRYDLGSIPTLNTFFLIKKMLQWPQFLQKSNPTRLSLMRLECAALQFSKALTHLDTSQQQMSASLQRSEKLLNEVQKSTVSNLETIQNNISNLEKRLAALK